MSYSFVLGSGFGHLVALGAGGEYNVRASGSAAGKGSVSSSASSGAPKIPDCKTVFSDTAARACCEKIKKTTGSAEQKVKAIKGCATKEVASLIPCKEARVTGVSTVDDAIVQCCEEIKRGDESFEKKAAGIADCIAHNTARGVGMVIGTAVGAAACAATGIGATVAVFCGMVGGAIGAVVGGFLYDRVSGYDTAQIVGGLAAGVVCAAISGGVAGPLCAIAAAELIGWLSDSVGPIIEGIFDPGAANRREQAARAAYHKAIEANEKACLEADEKYRLAWGLGVGSLKELYRKAFPTKALRVQAKNILGFDDVYDGIARAMRDAGAAAIKHVYMRRGAPGCWTETTSPYWRKEDVARFQAMDCANCERFDYVRLRDSTSSDPWDGVTAAWTIEGPAPWSDICPFSICKFYHDEREKALGSKSPKRDAVTAWEKKFAPNIKAVAEQIYPAMVAAITKVASQITLTATALKQQEILEAASKVNRTQLGSRVLLAATMAEGAAKRAKSGNAKERAHSVASAGRWYDIADASYKKLMFDEYGGTPRSAKAAEAQRLSCERENACLRVSKAMQRAAVAKKNAPIFAEQGARNRMIIGGVLVAGVAGAAYLAISK